MQVVHLDSRILLSALISWAENPIEGEPLFPPALHHSLSGSFVDVCFFEALMDVFANNAMWQKAFHMAELMHQHSVHGNPKFWWNDVLCS